MESERRSEGFEGRVVLVTGGSRGLGRALGEAFAAAGAKVALVAREPVALAQAVERVREVGRGEVIGIAADIGDKAAIHRITGEVAARLGPVDVLVHNASTLGPTPLPLLLDTECEDLERVLAVNLVGPFRLTKVVAGAMALRGEGLVVFVSSDAAVAAYSGWGAYGASKAAADHLGRIFAAELAADGVRVLLVDPGEMDTAMHAAAMPEADPASLSREGPARAAGPEAGLPASLARPAAVAERVLALLAAPAVVSGARLVVPASGGAA